MSVSSRLDNELDMINMAEPKPTIINDLIRNLNCSEFEKVISDSEKLQNQYPKSIKILSILITVANHLKMKTKLRLLKLVEIPVFKKYWVQQC